MSNGTGVLVVSSSTTSSVYLRAGMSISATYFLPVAVPTTRQPVASKHISMCFGSSCSYRERFRVSSSSPSVILSPLVS